MRQVDTPEFKRWFQGSVVVDERGEPLVVYHGTVASRFNVFETPAYFAESPDEASAYSFAQQTVDSDRARSYYRKASGAEYAGSRVPYTGIIKDLPEECRGTVCATDEGVVRVNSRHSVEIFTDLVIVPGSWRDDETIEIAAGESKAYEEAVESLEEYLSRFPGNRGGGRVYPVYLSIKNPKVLSPLQGNRFAKRLHAGAEEVAEIERLKAEGYDGIATTSDEASFFPEVSESLQGRVRQFIAFEPTQIKSAVGNKGTFDPSNPSIFEGVDMNLTLGKVYSKAEMLKAGADGYLDHALLTQIPVNLITGREPTPSMEGGYKEGTPIMQPVEVMFDRDSNSFVLYAGNHRVTQAEINGEDSILAFVEDPLRKYEELRQRVASFGDYPVEEERLHLSGFGSVDPSVQKLVEASLAEFGTTHDIREAGFILPDGRLLDLSGKNDGGNPGERSRDHYEIAAPARKAGIQGERYDVLTGVLKRGLIRISYIPSNRYFAAHFGAHPTSAQARALAAFVKACDSANVDVEVGKKTHTYELEGRVTVRKVLDAVEQHYAAPADFGSNLGPEDSEDWRDGEETGFEGFGDDAPDSYSLKRPHVGKKRQRRVSACASDNLDLKWMRLDSCMSRQGGTLQVATIYSSTGVSEFMHKVFDISKLAHEEFYVIPVDTKHVPMGVAKISQGGINQTSVDRVLVLRPAIMLSAPALFVCHNHPSGQPVPSNEDIELTKQLKFACTAAGLRLLDHVILTPDPRRYYSFVDGGSF